MGRSEYVERNTRWNAKSENVGSRDLSVPVTRPDTNFLTDRAIIGVHLSSTVMAASGVYISAVATLCSLAVYSAEVMCRFLFPEILICQFTRIRMTWIWSASVPDRRNAEKMLRHRINTWPGIAQIGDEVLGETEVAGAEGSRKWIDR